MHDNSRESWIRRHERDLMLLALTWAAGNIDAIGYLGLGRVFTANMTGNTVLLGLHLGQEQGAAALRAFVALVSFGVGLVMGALIVERIRGTGPWPPAVTWALALEAAMLAAFAAGMYLTASLREVIEAQALIAVSAIAMGIQSAAVRRLNVPGIATTYVTGTLTTAVTSLDRRVARREAEPPSTHPGAWRACPATGALVARREASAPRAARLRLRRHHRRPRLRALAGARRGAAVRRRRRRRRGRRPRGHAWLRAERLEDEPEQGDRERDRAGHPHDHARERLIFERREAAKPAPAAYAG